MSIFNVRGSCFSRSPLKSWFRPCVKICGFIQFYVKMSILIKILKNEYFHKMSVSMGVNLKVSVVDVQSHVFHKFTIFNNVSNISKYVVFCRGQGSTLKCMSGSECTK